MHEIGFSDSTKQLIAIASAHAIRMGSSTLHTYHIEDILFKRPDLFPEANYFIRLVRNIYYESFGPDSLARNLFCEDLKGAVEELSWSKELHESVLLAIQKAREMGFAELTPKLLLYGIFKNPNTQRHKLIVGKDPCGKLRLAKLVGDHFWRTGSDEAWIVSVKAWDFSLQGRYEEALTYYMKAQEMAPDEPLYVYNAILCLQQSGRFSEALEYSYKLLQMAPNEIGCHVVKITCLYHLGNYKEALKVCNQFPFTGKSDPEKQIFYWKGEVLLCLKKYRDALKCFDEALRIDPAFVNAWLAKSSILFTRNLKQAVHCNNKVLEIEPDNKIALQRKKELFKWKIRIVVLWIFAPIFILMLIAMLYALFLSCL